MEFSKLVWMRYSVRAYRSDPIEDSKLSQVLEAARAAPTACNRQPFQIIVIRTQGREAELRRIYPKDWFVQAPLVIAACGVLSETWTRKKDAKSYNDVDVAIVMDHLILGAADVGLGTCWVAAFDPEAARELLQLPGGVEPIAFTPLGYPADQAGTKVRKHRTEIVCWDHW